MAHRYQDFSITLLFGGVSNFTPGFDFISTDHVEVYRNAVLQAIDTDYTWNAGFTIVQFAVPSNAGDVVVIRRVTPYSMPLVNYTTGAAVNDSNLDTANLQHLYTHNEDDWRSGDGRVLLADVNEPVGNGAIFVDVPDWTSMYNHLQVDVEGVIGTAGPGGPIIIQLLDQGATVPDASLESTATFGGTRSVSAGITMPAGPAGATPSDALTGQFDIWAINTMIRGHGHFMFQFLSILLETELWFSSETANPYVRPDGFLLSVASGPIKGRVRVFGIP